MYSCTMFLKPITVLFPYLLLNLMSIEIYFNLLLLYLLRETCFFFLIAILYSAKGNAFLRYYTTMLRIVGTHLAVNSN